MFLIHITYKKPIEEVEKYTSAHRAFLDDGYKQDFFVVSGPKNPRTGGIILSQLTNREQLESIIKHDPFILNDIADYDIIEFSPVKYHPKFAGFV